MFMIFMPLSNGIHGSFMILMAPSGGIDGECFGVVFGRLLGCLWGHLVFLRAPRWASLVSISDLGSFSGSLWNACGVSSGCFGDVLKCLWALLGYLVNAFLLYLTLTCRYGILYYSILYLILLCYMEFHNILLYYTTLYCTIPYTILY